MLRLEANLSLYKNNFIRKHRAVVSVHHRYVWGMESYNNQKNTCQSFVNTLSLACAFMIAYLTL